MAICLLEADARKTLCSRNSELYWFVVCRPNCELNAVRHASFELEEAAKASGEAVLTQSSMSMTQLHTLADAAMDLQSAWAKYYAQ